MILKHDNFYQNLVKILSLLVATSQNHPIMKPVASFAQIIFILGEMNMRIRASQEGLFL